MQKSTIKSDRNERNGEPRGDRRPMKTAATPTTKAHSHDAGHSSAAHKDDAPIPKRSHADDAK